MAFRTVYVVAWHYDGGAGFDWYPKEEDAKKAFEEEKKNADTFKNEDWTAYYFNFDTEKNDADDVTGEIDEQLDELCENAGESYKAE